MPPVAAAGADEGDDSEDTDEESDSDSETVAIEWCGADTEFNDYTGENPENHIFYDRERRRQYNPGTYDLDPAVAAEYVAWRPSLPDGEGWRYVEIEDTETGENDETRAVEEVAESIVAGDLDHVRSRLSELDTDGALTDDLLDAVLDAETERAAHPEEHTAARKGVGEAVKSHRSE